MALTTVRIGSIVIDVKDFPRMMAFWREALGYESKYPVDPDDPFAILRDPTGKGPNVSIDPMEPYRNRLHLDLYTDDQEGEVKRLLGLGAKIFRPAEPGDDFVVLEDPEGNLFCVVDTKGY
jgi:predicted enzyme related to lactoylglutathione lyase